MNSLNHLAEVMATEAELTEQLVEVMKRQQAALIKTDAEGVARAVDRQEELMLVVEGLENERLRLAKEAWNEVTPQSTSASEHISLGQLLDLLSREQASQLSTVGRRLHVAVETIVQLNEANSYLIDHSRKFVKETFRIVTGGYTRQLFDQRI